MIKQTCPDFGGRKFRTEYQTPTQFDNLLFCSDGSVLTAIDYIRPGTGNSDAAREQVAHSLPVFRQASEWFDLYFAGKNPQCYPPYVFPCASLFAKRVWEMLSAVPYGTSVTYGELAKQYCARFNCPSMSAQAIGNAVGKNPFAIMIPCHRVIGSGGVIGGYSGGLHNKEALLKLENIHFIRNALWIVDKSDNIL